MSESRLPVWWSMHHGFTIMAVVYALPSPVPGPWHPSLVAWAVSWLLRCLAHGCSRLILVYSL